MIYCLSGKIIKKTMDSVVISCGGVGYCAQCPASVAAAMPGAGAEGTLYTVLNVTENDISLYGFATEEQQTCFKLLTGVSGVGPKVGLAILSVMEPDRVYLAVSAGDHKAFKAASGVGPKLAQRIVLELKDKVAKGAAGAAALEDLSGVSAARPAGPAAARPSRRWCPWGTARARPPWPSRRSTLRCRWRRSSGWRCAEWQGGDKPCRNRRFTVQK